MNVFVRGRSIRNFAGLQLVKQIEAEETPARPSPTVPRTAGIGSDRELVANPECQREDLAGSTGAGT
jgi:hypothetical protein